jgi:hypothetical protein
MKTSKREETMLKLIGPDYEDRIGCPDPARWRCWVSWRRPDGGTIDSFRGDGPSKAAAKAAAIKAAVDQSSAIIAWAAAEAAKRAAKTKNTKGKGK